ncbi:Phosphatidylserine decarboxylase-related protein [Macrophomina phaseolina MS6]|uniref:Phosphatidylserine decarboxylase-related protein n=1 Tax=Macrophomina phaseolina (strain MS6) TaxID=1126212 RepID=K2S6L1_MACPH|nr:Phosphatidylserine decarboxylase-related protein [Macrophomina phaseolina MS6]
MEEQDLHKYPNLAKFFYRTLKPGARPIDPNPNAVVSPADGKVVQFGTIDNGEVEQVKGVTYSLDALLGSNPPSRRNSDAGSNISVSSSSPQPSPERKAEGDEEIIKADEEFARVNGISYTLPNLFSGPSKGKRGEVSDQSTPHSPSAEAEVRADLELGQRPWWSPMTTQKPTALYYCVLGGGNTASLRRRALQRLSISSADAPRTFHPKRASRPSWPMALGLLLVHPRRRHQRRLHRHQF